MYPPVLTVALLQCVIEPYGEWPDAPGMLFSADRIGEGVGDDTYSFESFFVGMRRHDHDSFCVRVLALHLLAVGDRPTPLCLTFMWWMS